MNNNLPIIIFMIVHFIISGLLLWLFYVIIKSVFTLLWKPISNTDNSSINLFISFGITVIFFQRIVYDTIIKIAQFFISPIEKLKTLKSTFEEIYKYTELNISNLVFEWIRNLGDSFNDYILSIWFAKVIIFITIWLAMLLLIREIDKSIKSRKAGAETGEVSSFSDNPTLKNIFVIIIVLFSLYLCIASIIAVPEFQSHEANPTDIRLYSNFSAELDSVRIHDEESLKITPDSFPKSTVEGVNEVIEIFGRTVEDYNSELERNWSKDNKTKKTAENIFKNAIEGKMTPTEAIEYKTELTQWYASYNENWTIQSSYIKSGLRAVAEQIIRFIKKENKYIADTVNFDSNVTSRINAFYDEIWGYRNQLYTIYTPRSLDRIPGKPKIGEKFGIFRIISYWLLQTESTTLALIVGLFGFGLLGSIGSTYIRQRIRETTGKSNKETLILADLQGIIINGLSAAIVVFLAVKGAVIVFTTGGNELNAYVLFFSCLVAAVFSEDVWSWARNKLLENLDIEEKKEKEEQLKKKEEQKQLEQKKLKKEETKNQTAQTTKVKKRK